METETEIDRVKGVRLKGGRNERRRKSQKDGETRQMGRCEGARERSKVKESIKLHAEKQKNCH